MTVDSWDAAVAALRAVVVTVGDRLPADDVASVWELIDVGELGIAVENLCSQLHEYEVPLDQPTLATLAGVGGHLGLSPQLWQRLRQ